ncbi:hypothetical protein NVIE_003610 [Nitrososphaera viennensis EN76]|uniref:Uncharacterized protein n=1 Tax=Nitrososphaera viennensis EN76 TaxID=926571 RepID=A0A060HG34_9ARCH|nr:hypothetical protein NVIE_003610 [Nitrososphaera viennensis EN76]
MFNYGLLRVLCRADPSDCAAILDSLKKAASMMNALNGKVRSGQRSHAADVLFARTKLDKDPAGLPIYSIILF